MESSSSRFSVVPGFIRNRMREKKRREQEKALEEARRTEEPSESRYSDDDRKALSEMAGEGFAKGGMVTNSKSKSAGKKGRGDGICIKGHTKGKMY